MRVNAGELDRRIFIYRKGATDPDGYGEPPPELVHSCWARFTETGGRELIAANAGFGETKARFLIRRTAKPLDRKMFVRLGDTDYEIVYIDHLGGRQGWTELWCEARSRKGGT